MAIKLYRGKETVLAKESQLPSLFLAGWTREESVMPTAPVVTKPAEPATPKSVEPTKAG